MRRKYSDRSDTTSKPPSKSPGFPPSIFNLTTIALLAGVLVLGIGIGIALSSTATFTPSNVASREYIDTKAPNPEICVQYGASAVVMDARLFVTFNPFNVYVAQPNMRPGCVLRQNNWAILEQQKLVTSEQERECKNRLNTFGYTGDLKGDKPDIRCIYQNEAAQNFFVNQPGAVSQPQGTDRF
ncbi:MAG: DUF3172 domain-containing protein [Stigonema ocellatum SAG 48.90 = DSM 106950]|nr:DUF3172 domain-containing protein [Stigonema ocellatum SAG 48.90 = DSM 106950]